MIKDPENKAIPMHPPKQYRVTIAYGPYSKGDVITCNEPLRTILLSKRINGVPVIIPVEPAERRPILTRAKR